MINFDFSEALRRLKDGKTLGRLAWHDSTIFMLNGGYYMDLFGRQLPWCPTWDDLSANDWFQVHRRD